MLERSRAFVPEPAPQQRLRQFQQPGERRRGGACADTGEPPSRKAPRPDEPAWKGSSQRGTGSGI